MHKLTKTNSHINNTSLLNQYIRRSGLNLKYILLLIYIVLKDFVIINQNCFTKRKIINKVIY